MIRLIDFIETPDLSRTKIKFNMNAGNPDKRAWDLLLEDNPGWLEMNAWKTKQSNNNLNNADYLISLAQYYPYGPEYFIFGGLYRVKMKEPEVFDTVGYNLTLLDEYSEYIKRLIIKIDKPIGRDIYNRKYATIQEQLNPEVYELAPDVKIGTFPGYQNVCLRHSDLENIMNGNEPSWKQALSYVKGIYVITDISNGKLYIGSASGNTDGLWQRWSCYAKMEDPTGGNKEFKSIVNLKGRDYIIKNFSYTILEIFDTKTKEEDIIRRESYWKNVFKTKEFGMNHN